MYAVNFLLCFEYEQKAGFFKVPVCDKTQLEGKSMKKSTLVVTAAVAGLSLTGCATPQGRTDYTASGTLIGGATGAVIGSMTRNHAAGAAVGTAVGAILGGLVGHSLDQQQEELLRAQAPQTLKRVEQGQPLSVSDVQALASAGISDELIISQIRNSRTVYSLNTADIIRLKNNGVSETVIDFMINTQTQTDSTYVTGVVGPIPPAPLPDPRYEPPGPDYFWVAGTWLWLGDRWSWNHGYWHKPFRGFGAGPHR